MERERKMALAPISSCSDKCGDLTKAVFDHIVQVLAVDFGIEPDKVGDELSLSMKGLLFHLAEDAVRELGHHLGWPNRFAGPYRGLIDPVWMEVIWVSSDKPSVPTTLRETVIKNLRIAAIKIVRAKTGLGLKDSKDLVDFNWEEWRRLALGESAVGGE